MVNPAKNSTVSDRLKYYLKMVGSLSRLRQQDQYQILVRLCDLSEDSSLRLEGIRPGSIVFDLDGSLKGYVRLKTLHHDGDLSRRLGQRVIALRRLGEQVDPTDENIPDESHELGSSPSIETPHEICQPICQPITCVCRRSRIDGFYKEAIEAEATLPKSTSNLEHCAVYVTKTDKTFGSVLYLHSNFLSQGAGYTTKIATNESKDLLLLLLNIVYGRRLTEFEMRELSMAHAQYVKYIIASGVSVPEDLNLQGARNVIRPDSIES